MRSATSHDTPLGLTSEEAERRLAEHGPNQLDEAPREPRWRAFLRQFQDLLIIILLIAAVVSLVVTQEIKTPIAIAVVVLLNATIGFVQEARAEASLAALRDMVVTTARVRRDGRLVSVPSTELVPGDVIAVEAGDRVPADARLLEAVSLEVQESGLTGEAQPVSKEANAVVAPDAPLGDRIDSLFLNTSVTRGRGEAVVTATGMATETGRIADLLHGAEPGATPLQRQIDGLSRTLAVVSGVVIVVVLGLGLARGQDFGDLFVTAVSLAVAAIPEGLPAVVAFTLAMGTGRMAKRGAIVKRLASVETLGSTSQICTDKTGTLTLNQMTARVVLHAGRRFTVSGEGYSTEGRVRSTDGDPLPATLDDAVLALALCTDAALQDDAVVGDPTEGALVVLAEKAGYDVAAIRQARPRVLEVPFDSAHKFMATFHEWTGEDGSAIVRCFVKGAPDVLLSRADSYVGPAGVVPLTDADRARIAEQNDELAAQGLRVIAVGIEDFPAEDFPAEGLGSAPAPDDPKTMLDRLQLVALVGIVDPPRPEVRAAIAECHDAGIQVRMITGDHAVTAGAIAGELGIPGRAVTGADLDRVPEEELGAWLDDVGVVARVSPEHKIRLVRALQERGDVVAMTGDGVNDAPALRRADIGVAMGITGTEVTKEASTMVLTDDDFSTIVRAVREGRGIYDNIVKFTMFQVSTAIGFVLTFLVASLTGLAGGAPFTALQILFVNLVMDGPPAMSLGVDPVSEDAMTRAPRPAHERILSAARLLPILVSSAVMSLGTLAVLQWGPGPEPQMGEASTAATMAFATFVFFQVFNLLNVRHVQRSVFRRETLENASSFVATLVVIVLLVLLVEMDVLHGLLTTTDLTSGQWLTAVAVGSTVLWVAEIGKLLRRLPAFSGSFSGAPR
ncbi:cation-translocating P-type ATPase [Nocardioides pacificus]